MTIPIAFTINPTSPYLEPERLERNAINTPIGKNATPTS